MENFEFRNKKRPASVDGFITPKKSSNTARPNDLNGFNQYYRPKPTTHGPNSRPFSESFKQAKTGSVPGEVRRIDNFGGGNIDGFKEVRATTMDFGAKGQAPSSEITRAFGAATPRADYGFVRKPEISTGKHEPKSKRKLFGKKKKSHAKQHKRPKLRLAMRAGAVMGVFLLLIGAGLTLRAILIGNNIFKGGGNSALLNNQDVDPSQLNGEGDGRVNVLVLGKGGDEQTDGPDLTDTIIIASIDPIAKEAALLSIPRDFWVKSASGSSQSKINQVYYDAKHASLNKLPYKERGTDEARDSAEDAGIAGIKKVVSDTMGVPIHYYAMIDFAGFKKAVDTVGGISVNVPEDLTVNETMWIGGKNYRLDVKSGWQDFDGQRALAFSRSRKTSARGDFARADRQRAVILGLKDKVLSTGTLANPVRLNQLMGDFDGQLSTDFSVNEMLRLYDIIKEIPGDKVVSVGLDEYVGGSMLNGLSVQVPKAGTYDYSKIQNYVRNIMRDGFLKREDAKVIILNGTDTAGLATKKSNELKSFGYNVISIGDAPTKTYTQTVLIDMKKADKKYTLNYLEKRLGVTAIGSLPDSSIDASAADFVIILGTNEL